MQNEIQSSANRDERLTDWRYHGYPGRYPGGILPNYCTPGFFNPRYELRRDFLIGELMEKILQRGVAP
ncbi:MAG: hypothetical protein V3V31_12170 [Methylococcales bacterium]